MEQTVLSFNVQLTESETEKELHTLPCWMAGLSAPNNNSAVALLNAANPSIGKYCNTKWN